LSRRLLGAVSVAIVLGLMALLQVSPATAGPAGTAGARHKPVKTGARVSRNVHHDVSPPLRDIPPSRTPGTAHPALRVPAGPSGPVVRARDTSGAIPGSALIPGTTANFDGIAANGSAPPDTQGAAGSTQYFQMANTQIAVYSKAGGVILTPRGTNTLWSGFGGGCQTNNDGDGVVLWDWISQRWVISQFSVSTTPYLECVAVSTTSDATGTYNRYSFSYSSFPDYPKMGVWPDAYYTTFNLFDASGTTALGTETCAYNRSAMLAGSAATQQCFMAYSSGENTVLPASLEGTATPPAGAPNYQVGLATSGSSLGYFKFHVDWTTPANSTLTGPTNLAVAAFTRACTSACVPQSGTTTTLDGLGDRVMARLAYRKFSDHEALVVNHAIVSGSSVGERWYELRVGTGNNLSVFQQGTVAPDATYRWMGSIASDQSGDLAIGYSASSSSLHPGIRYTGRLPGDAAGTMPQGEGTIITGAGSQTGGLTRWGDYSSMTVDPADDCTFWYTNEYIPANGSFNWHTRIASFKFPSCGGTATNDFSISASPSSISVVRGSSGTSTISTAVTSGSAQSITLSASGLPSGAGASFSPNPITAGNSSTMTITTSATTPTGTFTVTVTGTGTSATHSTTVSLTVTSGGSTQLLGNPGFETGTAAPWVATAGVIDSSAAEPAHSGAWKAWLDGYGTNHTDTLYQQVTIPSTAASATLTFWLHIDTSETTTTTAFDTLKVQIRNSSNTVLSTLATYSNLNAASGYSQKSFNVTSFAGQTIRVYLLGVEDVSLQTSFVCDDFALNVT
jgi:hypothetical protein